MGLHSRRMKKRKKMSMRKKIVGKKRENWRKEVEQETEIRTALQWEQARAGSNRIIWQQIQPLLWFFPSGQ